jgi:hypothetical protein
MSKVLKDVAARRFPQPEQASIASGSAFCGRTPSANPVANPPAASHAGRASAASSSASASSVNARPGISLSALSAVSQAMGSRAKSKVLRSEE